MMPKIVHDRHAARDAANFHPAFDSFERVERALNLLVRQTAMFCCCNHRESVADIQFADKVQVKLEARNFKLRRRRAKTQIESTNGIIFAEAEFFDRTMRDVQK